MTRETTKWTWRVSKSRGLARGVGIMRSNMVAAHWSPSGVSRIPVQDDPPHNSSQCVSSSVPADHAGDGVAKVKHPQDEYLWSHKPTQSCFCTLFMWIQTSNFYLHNNLRLPSQGSRIKFDTTTFWRTPIVDPDAWPDSYSRDQSFRSLQIIPSIPHIINILRRS